MPLGHGPANGRNRAHRSHGNGWFVKLPAMWLKVPRGVLPMHSGKRKRSPWRSTERSGGFPFGQILALLPLRLRRAVLKVQQQVERADEDKERLHYDTQCGNLERGVCGLQNIHLRLAGACAFFLLP